MWIWIFSYLLHNKLEFYWLLILDDPTSEKSLKLKLFGSNISSNDQPGSVAKWVSPEKVALVSVDCGSSFNFHCHCCPALIVGKEIERSFWHWQAWISAIEACVVVVNWRVKSDLDARIQKPLVWWCMEASHVGWNITVCAQWCSILQAEQITISLLHE